MQENRECLECGEPLRGRADQRFCDGSCRTSYNNKLNKEVNQFLSKVNSILRRNRTILHRLNPNGKTKVSRQILLNSGFRFEFMTNTYTTKSGKKYQFCYDYGLLALEDDMYALVKKGDYVV